MPRPTPQFSWSKPQDPPMGTSAGHPSATPSPALSGSEPPAGPAHGLAPLTESGGSLAMAHPTTSTPSQTSSIAPSPVHPGYFYHRSPTGSPYNQPPRKKRPVPVFSWTKTTNPADAILEASPVPRAPLPPEQAREAAEVQDDLYRWMRTKLASSEGRAASMTSDAEGERGEQEHVEKWSDARFSHFHAIRMSAVSSARPSSSSPKPSTPGGPISGRASSESTTALHARPSTSSLKERPSTSSLGDRPSTALTACSEPALQPTLPHNSRSPKLPAFPGNRQAGPTRELAPSRSYAGSARESVPGDDALSYMSPKSMRSRCTSGTANMYDPGLTPPRDRQEQAGHETAYSVGGSTPGREVWTMVVEHPSDSEGGYDGQGCAEGGGASELDVSKQYVYTRPALTRPTSFAFPGGQEPFSNVPLQGSESTSPKGWWGQMVVHNGRREVVQAPGQELVRKGNGQLVPRSRTLLAMDIVLDPEQKVQWFGDWDEEELYTAKKPKVQWTKDDLAVFPGLPGKVSMLAFMDHTFVLFIIALLLCICGGGLISLSFWATNWLPFLVSGFLCLRAITLLGHALFMWLSMEGAEVALAFSYPWLDVVAAGLISGLHFVDVQSLHICVGCWLVARGLWLEGMALISNWNENGREWWLILLAIWPPVVVGGLLIGGRPLVADWYITAVLGAACFIDGLPLWATVVSVRVQMMDGEGWAPEYARQFVTQSVATGCMVHGVMRISMIALCSVAFYVAST